MRGQPNIVAAFQVLFLLALVHGFFRPYCIAPMRTSPGRGYGKVWTQPQPVTEDISHPAMI
jgi:hypothetical protein